MKIECLNQIRHLKFIHADETNEIEMGRGVGLQKLFKRITEQFSYKSAPRWGYYMD